MAAFSEVLLGKLRELGYADRSSDSVTPSAVSHRPLPAQSTHPSTAGGRRFDRRHSRARHLLRRLAEANRRTDPRHAASAAAFMTVFARQLSVPRREAVVAEDGTRLLPDRIVVAPAKRIWSSTKSTAS
jgi:hypothetical protein